MKNKLKNLKKLYGFSAIVFRLSEDFVAITEKKLPIPRKEKNKLKNKEVFGKLTTRVIPPVFAGAVDGAGESPFDKDDDESLDDDELFDVMDFLSSSSLSLSASMKVNVFYVLYIYD